MDSIRFGDYIKDYNISLLPDQYKELMIMDILSLTKKEIAEMGYIEYNEAVNYATATYKLRSMAISEKKKPSGPTYNFDQPKDFDIDPNFVSNVGN